MRKLVGFSLLVVSVGLATSVLATSAGAATSSPDTTAQATVTTLSASDFETRLLARTSARRARHGCRALRLSSALQLAARLHSTRMAGSDELSHQLAGEPDLGGRAVAAGYTNWRMLAENLAWGQATPGQVFREWLRSAGHRANLDNCRLRDVGIGVVIQGGKPWVTEDFGRRRR